MFSGCLPRKAESESAARPQPNPPPQGAGTLVPLRGPEPSPGFWYNRRRRPARFGPSCRGRRSQSARKRFDAVPAKAEDADPQNFVALHCIGADTAEIANCLLSQGADRVSVAALDHAFDARNPQVRAAGGADRAGRGIRLRRFSSQSLAICVSCAVVRRSRTGTLSPEPSAMARQWPRRSGVVTRRAGAERRRRVRRLDDDGPTWLCWRSQFAGAPSLLPFGRRFYGAATRVWRHRRFPSR